VPPTAGSCARDGSSRAALGAARRGSERAGDVLLDYEGATVSDAALATDAFAAYVRNACGAGFERRAAAVSIRYPRIEPISASLSQATFALSRTPSGWVVWGRIH
jgi:hypothetical protein